MKPIMKYINDEEMYNDEGAMYKIKKGEIVNNTKTHITKSRKVFENLIFACCIWSKSILSVLKYQRWY